MAPDEILSVKQVSDLCGVSRETIRRWIRKGRLRAYNTGGERHIKIVRSDFEEFVEENNILTSEVLSERQDPSAGVELEEASRG